MTPCVSGKNRNGCCVGTGVMLRTGRIVSLCFVEFAERGY